MYDWRAMSPEERERALRERQQLRRPWHRPPHFASDGMAGYLVTAACYERVPIIGKDASRLGECEESLIEICQKYGELAAWCVLPNHYHALVQTGNLGGLRTELGRWHGRSSHRWNEQDEQLGRQVWHSDTDRLIRSERHFWTSVNYVHNNPVRHGYVERWQDWPFSSASEFIERVGRERAIEIWREYPLHDYGKDWD